MPLSTSCSPNVFLMFSHLIISEDLSGKHYGDDIICQQDEDVTVHHGPGTGLSKFDAALLSRSSPGNKTRR
jgi:hypothetical protein